MIAAIAWIGGSFYFIALDNHLGRRANARRERGIGGEAWEIHGGGFYRIEKFRVAPERLPEPLHWFKWEAYTTWLSGFALFVVVYYVHARHVPDRPSGRRPRDVAGDRDRVARLAAAWLVYDGLCRVFDGDEGVLAVLVVRVRRAHRVGTGELFSPRASYLQVGAMIGTMMVGERLLRDHPGALEARPREGGGPRARPALEPAASSARCTTTTSRCPCCSRCSQPLPAAYGHARLGDPRRADGVGAWIRHYFNLRHAGERLVDPGDRRARDPRRRGAGAARGQGRPRRPTQVRSRRRRRSSSSAACRATRRARRRVVLDRAEGDPLRHPRRDRRAGRPDRAPGGRLEAMPLGNVTGMTDAERELLGAWIDQGAGTR